MSEEGYGPPDEEPLGEAEEPMGEPEEPMGDEERDLLRQDLVDVHALKELLGSRGIKGVVFYCPDCGEDHYLAWDLLAGNLRELLDEGESPVHEPAFDPDPNQYVSWDYARGFLDGYESYDEELDDSLATLVLELEGKGLSRPAVAELLRAAGFEMPSADDPRSDR